MTLFGESAGGEDTIALLASTRAARGLFQRAIAESAGGGWGPPPTRSEAESQGTQLATKLKLAGAQATLSDLRAVPMQAIVESAQDEDAGPIVDGRLLTRSRPSARSPRGRLSRTFDNRDERRGRLAGPGPGFCRRSDSRNVFRPRI